MKRVFFLILILSLSSHLSVAEDGSSRQASTSAVQGSQSHGTAGVSMELKIPPKDLQGKMTPKEGQICQKYLEIGLDNFEPNEQKEKARVQSVYNLFVATYGAPPKDVNLGVGETKKRNKRKCAMTIFDLSKGVSTNREKFNVQWVAHFVIVPDILFPKPASLSPEEYEQLPQDERVSRIREVDPEQVYMIPRTMREGDFKRAKEMDKPMTHGTFGLADEWLYPQEGPDLSPQENIKAKANAKILGQKRKVEE